MPDDADKVYTVVVTATAKAAIRDQVQYIAVGQQSPQSAAEWLDRVWTAIDGLKFLPARHGPADGYERLPYLVRRVVLDNHLILFTIDAAAATVYVVGLRHGARRPGPLDLPPDPRG